MRKQPQESLNQWAERVQKYELDFAMKELKKGADINFVMEAMAARIQQKMLHPMLIEAKELLRVDYDVESSKKAYYEAFKKNNPSS
jgi:glutamyl-tRNA reductase